MKWRKKQHPKKKAEEIKEGPLPTPPPPPSSSSSSIFSFSTWISKLKKKMTSNSTEQRRSTATGPHPKPLFSPPRSKSDRHQLSSVSASASASASASEVPRRLSVGEEDSHLARSRTCRVPPLPRSARHYSAGGDLDFVFRSDIDLIVSPADAAGPDPAVRRRRRSRGRRSADRGILEEIEVDSNPIQLKPIEIRRPIKSGRRSFSGGKVGPRVRVYSPRLKKRAPMGEEKNSNCSYSSLLESFAVVKSSSDPIRDFRESMVEMIWEKGIQRPEELEGLLACYLSLNSDEHHDVIVKVFRQVWFDLDRVARRSLNRGVARRSRVLV